MHIFDFVAGRSYVSTFNAEYVPHSLARTSVDFKTKENQTRGSNFQIGTSSPLHIQTTNQQNFQSPPKDYKAQTIDAATKADLRRSHWTMGGFGPTYISTNGMQFAKRSPSVSDKLEIANKIQMMRGHHFDFGN